MNPRLSRLRGAATAPLLLVVLFLAACAGPQASTGHDSSPSAVRASSPATTASGAQQKPAEKTDAASGTTVKALLPKDVLSEKDLKATPPKYEDFYNEGSSTAQTPGSTAGAIPAVRPFNFGRDPGGPADKTLYLTVPKLGLKDVPVYNSISEEKLKEGTVHIPVTGFPWQKGANTYIAGHRLGYEGTGSYLVFYYLNDLVKGDEILLKDSAGTTYTYRVTKQMVVNPDNVEVMNAVEGESVVSLQTCTLPDYKQRLIVRGELVDKSA